MRWAFQLSSFQKLVTKPLAIATRLDDTEFLAQLEAVDRFTSQMTAYPGRSFGQLYHRFAKGNALASGTVDIGGRDVSLSAITAPVLVFAGANDGIAPVGLGPRRRTAAERFARGALRDRARRAPRHAHRPGGPGHDLAGARRVGRPSGRARSRRAKKARPRRRPRRRPTVAKKAPAKKAAKKAPAKKAAPADGIGTNPTRRYGSGGSRSLSR